MSRLSEPEYLTTQYGDAGNLAAVQELGACFARTDLRRRVDELRISDARPLVDYVRSMADANINATITPVVIAHGTLLAEDRDAIYDATGRSAAVRQRRSWTARLLTIVGPPHRLQEVAGRLSWLKIGQPPMVS